MAGLVGEGVSTRGPEAPQGPASLLQPVTPQVPSTAEASSTGGSAGEGQGWSQPREGTCTELSGCDLALQTRACGCQSQGAPISTSGARVRLAQH